MSKNKNIVNVVATGGADKKVCVWNVNESEAKLVQTHEMPNVVACVQFHPTQLGMLLIGVEDGSLHLLDCKTEQVVKVINCIEFANHQLMNVFISEWDHNNCFVGLNNGFIYEVDCVNSKVLRNVNIGVLSTRKSRGNEISFIEA